jgi:hypothetical protein
VYGTQTTYNVRFQVFTAVKANVVHSSQILATMMMETLRSSETLLIIKATLRNIPEDGILQQHTIISYAEETLILFT